MLTSSDRPVILITFEVAHGSCQGRLAQVSADHPFGPTPRRVQRKAAGISKDVQHPFPGRQPFYSGPVLALIQKETGFLAVYHIYFKMQPIFQKRH